MPESGLPKVVLRNFGLAALLLVGAFSLSSEAEASALLLDFDGTGDASVTGGELTLGYEFTVNNPFTIDGLGSWDEGADGLLGDHLVRLWDISDSLLASATITDASSIESSASGVGQWLFESIGDLTLAAGSYVIATTYFSDDLLFYDLARYDESATTIPQVTLGQDLQCSGACIPNLSVGLSDGIFGPNLRVADRETSVPLPASLPLFLSSFLLMTLVMRRGKSVRARY